MAATRNEVDRSEHKIYLSVLEIQDVQAVLLARSKDLRHPGVKRANCKNGYDWLDGLIRDKPLIAEVEVVGRHWVLDGIGKACIADGLGDVGADILNQIAGGE